MATTIVPLGLRLALTLVLEPFLVHATLATVEMESLALVLLFISSFLSLSPAFLI